ncbi:uncharacterized protein [Onthophagus taurus]|uniref:uncharacterized protein n=1 Tax=Onthophagus taurus TaxID=166361 RepID=UPI000C205E7B|nr:uncharacterized protein LOC111413682 [Onthophagus taurus]
MLYKRLFLCLIQLYLLTMSSTEDIISENRNGSDTILSRRKRYLVFPEGSSLQLVCEYVWPIVGQPNIWVLAISAALAWQLPSKPEHFGLLKKLKKEGEKRIDKFTKQNQLITYQKNPILPLIPNTPLTQQNFIPWNYNTFYTNTTYNPPWYAKEWRKPYQKIKYQKKPYLYDETNYYNHPLYTRLHRISRRGLYPKIEHFLTAQKKDGKACLLRALCEVNRYPEGKGSFIQEIIKTIFRNKPSHVDEDIDEYDHATLHEEDCRKMYPTCTYD